MFPRRLILAGIVAVASAGWSPAANQFVQHNLISDLAGLADHQDANLVNPWGICASTSSPFWFSDNGTGVSTLDDGNGTAIPLKVAIPAPNGTDPGAPSGCVFNSTTGFAVDGKAATFMFSTEDGTILGWNGSAGTTAVILADRSNTGAIYKGLAIATRASGPAVYAANFHAGTVDVWDQNMTLQKMPGAFADPSIPKGFAPFNIQYMNGRLYVTYAMQDDDKEDDVAGPGNGYVDTYNVDGELLQKLVVAGALNSPWGLAVAPPYFGDFSNAILVGNFGDGKINAYNALSGAWIGNLKDAYGNDIEISGLWGLMVGNGGKGGDKGALYFTAGIAGPDNPEDHGLFGLIQPDPVIASVFNAASFGPAIGPGAFGSVKGSALAPTTRSAGDADTINGQLPIQLDGVSMTVDGRPAYIGYISPGQINFIAPPDTSMGQVSVVVYNNEVASAWATVWLQPYAPGFFTLTGGFISATHADGSPVGSTTLVPDKSTPAVPGETISLFGTGFGPTNPPMDGRVLYAPVPAATWPAVWIGGLQATVSWAGLSAAGTYRIDVVVPSVPQAKTPTVDVPVTATVSGSYTSQNGVLVTVMPKP
ncbi:MAG TPA: TIGR03118 family protein [Bryobacteraceae bacterium]|nr:TIGR03118 family protein [Bryobacteraceae bacterium]